jgi:hypothetical protein
MSLNIKKMAAEILVQFEDIPNFDAKMKHVKKMEMITNLSEEKCQEFSLKYSNDLTNALIYISKIETEKLLKDK